MGCHFSINKEDMKEKAATFMNKYQDHMHTAGEYTVPPVTVKRLMQAIRSSPATAAGPDGWFPADMRTLSPQALRWLTNLLNMIEEGANWPDQLCAARAVSLAKTQPPSTDDVFKYRLLLMLSAVYRLWARMRLHDVSPWIAAWDLEEFYAGVPGKGAEHAWYKTAVELEFNATEGIPTAMAIIDLSKAFDHIPRDLLYSLLEKGGFPKRLLQPYTRFQENLTVFYTVGDHSGEVHTRDRSIPQGDQWRMMEMEFPMRRGSCS